VVVAPIAIAILIGLVAGAMGRGRLTTLARVHLSRFWLLAVAVGCALGADLIDLPVPAVFAVAGLLAGIGFAASNLLIPGMAVVGIGVAINLAPVALNGAMPVRAEALVDAHIVAASDLDRVELSGARELADSDTILEILGDVIPLSPFGQVMSFGDLIVLVGLADVVANLMRARRPRRLPHGAAATLIALGWEMPPDDDIFIDLRASLGEPLSGLRLGEMKPAEPSPRWARLNPTTAPTWESVSALSSSDTW
jgi:Family of unknown function (DUF5317)